MARPVNNKGECYACGRIATTHDHIPPKCIFSKPRPTDLITVPACKSCNESTKLDDEYFRLMVVAGSGDSDKTFKMLHQRILPQMRKSPALIIDFLKSVRPVEIHTEGGIYLGKRPGFSYNRPRIQAVINKIVRALYYKNTGTRLSDEIRIDDFIHNPPVKKPLQDLIMALPLHTVGDGMTFSYRFLLGKAGMESYWFLMFYDYTNLFIVRAY